jgi:hypothetical protein
MLTGEVFSAEATVTAGRKEDPLSTLLLSHLEASISLRL